MKVDLPDEALDAVAGAIADRVWTNLEERLRSQSPWMTTEEAIAYSRLPKGTFERRAAAGEIRSHGGKSKHYNRYELDQDLGYSPEGPPRVARLGAA